MRRILFTFLLCLTAGSALLTACRHADDAWMAQRQALFRLIVSVHNSGQEEIACKLDSLNRTALPADRHARALWQLAQAWLTATQTNRGIDDSLLLPVVDYLTQHGAPGEQVEALLLRARSQEWRGEMEQAQHTYSQALQVALKSGDPHTEMRCRQLLTSFYLQRTHLKDEGARAARRFLQLAEACRDTAALALAHMYMGRLYFAAIHEDTLYNRPEEGVEHFRQAAKLAALAKNQYLEMQSKYELGILYMTYQQPFEALPLLKETKDYLYGQTPDDKQPILMSLIQTYLQLDRPDSAQVYIDEAMTLPDRNNLRYNIYDLLFQYHRAKQQYARSVWPRPAATTVPASGRNQREVRQRATGQRAQPHPHGARPQRHYRPVALPRATAAHRLTEPALPQALAPPRRTGPARRHPPARQRRDPPPE